MTERAWLTCDGLNQVCLVVAVPALTSEDMERTTAIDAFLAWARTIQSFDYQPSRWAIDAERLPAMDGLAITNWNLLVTGVIRQVHCMNCKDLIQLRIGEDGQTEFATEGFPGAWHGVTPVKDEQTGGLVCSYGCRVSIDWGRKFGEAPKAFPDFHVRDLVDPDLYPTYPAVREGRRFLAARDDPG